MDTWAILDQGYSTNSHKALEGEIVNKKHNHNDQIQSIHETNCDFYETA